jgi:S-DNA-T family DNA segregation ATPase FtsK/SpoIIIE
MVGLAETCSVRSHWVDPDTGKAIVARAVALRGGVVGGDVPVAPARDVLADVLRVFADTGRRGLAWQQLPALLADIDADVYARHTPESVSALLRGQGVPSEDVKVDGKGIKGCRRVDVEKAIAGREIEQPPV